MSNKKIEDTVEKIALPVINDLNFELVDMEYKKEGSNWYLRFYIDKPGGITIDDCQTVSERLSKLLDEIDPIPHSYFLEVSSPGLDRILKKDSDFIKYMGFKVDINLYRQVNGKKKYTGELSGFTNDSITINENDNILTFNRSDISSVRLSVEF